MRKSSKAELNFELLETRRVLAGNVQAFVADGVLVVIGDSQDNQIEMNQDESYSKNLSEVEERKKGYLARRVEASDKERVDATSNPSRPEPVGSGETAVTGVEPETAVEFLTPGTTSVTGVEPEVSSIPPSNVESRLCDWIECSHDRRTWAEVQEEEQRERTEGGLRPLQAPPLSSSTKISADTNVPGATVKPNAGVRTSNQSNYDVCEVISTYHCSHLPSFMPKRTWGRCSSPATRILQGFDVRVHPVLCGVAGSV